MGPQTDRNLMIPHSCVSTNVHLYIGFIRFTGLQMKTYLIYLPHWTKKEPDINPLLIAPCCGAVDAKISKNTMAIEAAYLQKCHWNLMAIRKLWPSMASMRKIGWVIRFQNGSKRNVKSLFCSKKRAPNHSSAWDTSTEILPKRVTGIEQTRWGK